MPIELRIPEVGESITEVQIGAWLKRVGDPVRKDESLVEIESDKATAELPAPADGVLTQIVKKRGEMAQVGETIAYMEEKGAAATTNGAGTSKPTEVPTAAAAAAGAPTAGRAERAARRPWRTRRGGRARATAAASKTRDTRREAASADPPRARHRQERPPHGRQSTGRCPDRTDPRGRLPTRRSIWA